MRKFLTMATDIIKKQIIMKTGILYRFSTILMIAALCIASCTESPVDDGSDGDGNNNGENVEDGGNDNNGGNEDDGGDGGNTDIPSTQLVVPINLTGEILNPGNIGTRASGNDLYYIQAYTVGNDEEDFMPYAHGLFDNAEGLKIILDKDRQYKFLATMVVDGKNRISIYDGIYGQPFLTGLTNKFVTGEEFDGYNISNGEAEILNEGYWYMPDLDRYYGESDIYTADPDNSPAVDIDMIRTVFGLKVTVENLNEGRLIISVDGSPEMEITPPATQTSGIFSFNPLYYIYGMRNEVYSESLSVLIKQLTPEGFEIPVSNEIYEFYRNRMTTLKVTLTGEAHSSGVTVTTEDTPMQPDGQGEIEFVGGGTVIPLPGN